MRLAFTTADFIYSGQPRPGFPLILGSDMQCSEPFHSFLKHRLLDSGGALKPGTWDAYGRRVWDFARFLNDNNISWIYDEGPNGEGPVLQYQSWSLQEKSVSRSTYNGRVRLVVELYEWALKEGLVRRVPFSYHEVSVPNDWGMLSHITEEEVIKSPDVLAQEWETEIDFLSPEQVRECLDLRMPAGTRLLFQLMKRVGLRSCEARSFPTKYVFNPAKRRDCSPDQMIRVTLSPKDMHIKYSKERVVHVPYALMVELYSYMSTERNRLSHLAQTEVMHELILNSEGKPFTKGSAIDAFRWISKKVGFHCRPHMLRHTYAIHTLGRLRARREFEGEPLLYVRDRLGHSSVETTAIYLKQLNLLDASLVLAIESEFDDHFSPLNERREKRRPSQDPKDAA